ncbi:MAG: carboxymuconolactone decarboxylase family protein [Nocardioidaceae bacterium]|jgi:alkylhydroperoxidase family enzyme|nr:carboxymuconolactone decarboxylase family protein [Nocardioidaceae bacterium]
MTDAWIHMVAEDEAAGELSSYYASMRDPSTRKVDNILRIHGQHPDTLEAHYSLYGTLMHGRSPVPRWEREMIAVVVSALNSCHY